MAPPTDTPGVIAPPPLIFVGCLAAGYIIDSFRAWPAQFGAAQTGVAIAMIVIGFGLSGWSVLEFVRHGTHPDPRHPTTTLITTGPFRFSRNPIYVAFTLMHLGAALWVGSRWMLLAIIPALTLIHYGVILPEERYLTGKFGDLYSSYRTKVRRWL